MTQTDCPGLIWSFEATLTTRTFCQRSGSRESRAGYPRRVHFDELTPPEQRVLGCLIEKRWTTPDQYPLSLNALRLACNQSTNRDPVTAYDEATVRQAADRLTQYGLARLASGHGSRATKYRHLAEEGLGLGREELAVLAVLLLRGRRLRASSRRAASGWRSIASLTTSSASSRRLTDRGYVRRIERRPGQKEDRFEQLLGGAGDGEPLPADSRRPHRRALRASPRTRGAGCIVLAGDGDLESRGQRAWKRASRRCGPSSRDCSRRRRPLRSATRARPGTSRRRRSRRRASSRGRRTTSCAA